MYKKVLLLLFLIAVSIVIFINDDTKVIIFGIAVFLIGMFFMEDGFKIFSGGYLENILKNSTSTLFKSISTGVISTSIIQSSSLISIIVISFLGAGLISLGGAIGVVFGSNLGTTTTAWIISLFGVKVQIGSFAMPMLILGVILKFSSNKNLNGLGFILIGLGFVFLGISYMKDGFETLKDGMNLANYAIQGPLGVFVYVLLGMIATVIIQSSSATLALIIIALATNQIVYVNAIELAIGANIGTTITAILGSLASNENGKRLAVAHFIFNMVTAFVAIVFLNQLSSIVLLISEFFNIAKDDYVMQLAIFHTLFNVIGILLLVPFTKRLVKFLETLFVKKNISIYTRAIYLETNHKDVPSIALNALTKEMDRLYDSSIEVISHSLNLHRHDYLGKDNYKKIVILNHDYIDTDVDDFYKKRMKYLYGDIMYYATIYEENMNFEQKNDVAKIKLVCRDLVEAVKDIKHLQKNLNKYIISPNTNIKKQYSKLRLNIVNIIYLMEKLKDCENQQDYNKKIIKSKEKLERLDYIKNKKIDKLIRNNLIDSNMATSLINDSKYTIDIAKKISNAAKVICLKRKYL
jgi:phosphate:Na+ symporter